MLLLYIYCQLPPRDTEADYCDQNDQKSFGNCMFEKIVLLLQQLSVILLE